MKNNLSFFERSVSREEMQEIDRRAVEEFGIPSLLLMENAGRAVAEEALPLLATLGREPTLAVLCGKGNNGGDGFVAARHLANQGLNVSVWLASPRQEILHRKGDAATNLAILLKMGFLPIREIPADLQLLDSQLKHCSLIIDALFGTGLNRPLSDPDRLLVETINRLRKPILSVDVPSGLDCNEGLPLGAAIRATVTVTFGLSKKGFFCRDGPAFCGSLRVADISLPRPLLVQNPKVTAAQKLSYK